MSAEIIDASARVHGVSVADILSESRERKFMPARQAIAVLLDARGMDATQIARILNRAHNSSARSLLDAYFATATPEREAQIDAVRIVAMVSDLSRVVKKTPASVN